MLAFQHSSIITMHFGENSQLGHHVFVNAIIFVLIIIMYFIRTRSTETTT